MYYSVVIPIKDEEDNIPLLIAQIEPVMESLAHPWELICVDDGSKDGSLALLKQLCFSKPYLKVICLERNFGQSSAFSVGFQEAKGDFIITMDADLQNDPADIPKLTAAISNCDLVVGWRIERKDPLSKKWISKFSNYIRSRLCQDKVHDTGCSLKVMRKEALKKIKLFKGMHRFLPALFVLEGFCIKEIPVKHHPRQKGQSKYGFSNRLLSPIIDMFVVLWMRRRKLNHKVREVVHHHENT